MLGRVSKILGSLLRENIPERGLDRVHYVSKGGERVVQSINKRRSTSKLSPTLKELVKIVNRNSQRIFCRCMNRAEQLSSCTKIAKYSLEDGSPSRGNFLLQRLLELSEGLDVGCSMISHRSLRLNGLDLSIAETLSFQLSLGHIASKLLQGVR